MHHDQWKETGFCLDPLKIGGRKTPFDPMNKNNARRMKEYHKKFDMWKRGEYVLATDRNPIDKATKAAAAHMGEHEKTQWCTSSCINKGAAR
jgi:hypothetical protein